jgi:phosphoribosylanthranilate isomerase
MRVKICGITNIDDAVYAVKVGADALGFVFYENSPRYISPEDTKRIISSLPPFIERVGLFVECSIDFIEETTYRSGISLAQIHFDVDEKFLDTLKVPNLPVVRAKSKDDILKFQDRYRLVDAYTSNYGGSGKRLNIEWFDEVDCSKIVIAGGLTADNIKELRGYGFYGVDVSSGVEMKKGKKSHPKVLEFISNAKTI